MAKQNKTVPPVAPEISEQNQSPEKLLVGLWANTLDGVMVFQTLRDRSSGKIIDFVWLSANLAAESMLGHGPLIGKSFLNTIPQAKKNGLFSLFIEVAENGQSKDGEFPYEFDWIQAWFRIVANKFNNGLAITFEDITVRKLSASTIQRSEEHFRSLIVNATDIITILDTSGYINYVSPAVERILGYKPDELLNQSCFNFIHHDDLSHTIQTFSQREKKIVRGILIEFRFLHKNGGWRTLEAMSRLINAEDNKIKLIVNARDISERKKAEEALRESEERFRSLTALSSQWYWEQDENFRFTLVSRGILEKTGIAPEEGIGKTRWELPIVGITDAEWDAHKAQLYAHQPFYDFIIKRLDDRGGFRYLSISGQPVLDKAGAFKGYRGIGKDVTEHKRLQDAVYEIAAGVSAETGEPFFRLLVQHLARALNVKYVFIGELLDAHTVQTIAVCIDNKIVPNLTYDLANAPCENVVGKKLCIYPSNVQKEFPKDKLLSQMNAQGYAGCPLFNSSGYPLGVLVVMDVNPFDEIEFTKTMLQIFAVRASSELERKQGEDRLRLSDLVFKNTNEGIIVTDNQGVIQSINPAFAAMSGYHPEEIIGKTPRILKSGRHNEDFYINMWESLIKYGHWQGDIWNRRKNGEIYPGWLNITEVRNNKDELVHYAAIFSDITELKLTEERLYHLAHHDVLTNLPNRPLFHDRLHQAIAQAQRNQSMVAIIFLDLDRFKSINDSLGHEAGDLLLCAFSERIRQSVRESDTIARIGGDEFTIILDNIQEIHNAAAISEKIISGMRAPFRIAGHELYITTSIGISIYPMDGNDVGTLVKNADTAMYSAKKRGRNQFNFYTVDMNAASLVHLTLENQLRRALERNELVLHYQPQIELATGKVIGAEALIRWQHPERGLLSPGEFILLAEETGLIVPIGEWVVKTACNQAQMWHHQGWDSFKVAVNLSARQLGQQDLLLKTVARLLQDAPLAPEFFELEVTESMLMENIESTAATLKAISNMGISIALDDFGTGYSSLNYLKRLPLNSLKIDRSFVMDIPKDTDDVKITESILGLAHNLGLTVIAEGVETQEQLNFLKTYQCDFAQGFLFSKPVSPEDFTKVYKVYENCLRRPS